MFEQNHLRGSIYLRSSLLGTFILEVLFQLTPLGVAFAVSGFLGVDFDIFPVGEPSHRALQSSHLPRAEAPYSL